MNVRVRMMVGDECYEVSWVVEDVVDVCVVLDGAVSATVTSVDGRTCVGISPTVSHEWPEVATLTLGGGS
jgi:hypothetical protein